MIQVELDKNYIDEAFKQELAKRLDEIESHVLFWDMKELQRQTNMSVNTIKDTFFYDDRFKSIRRKVGQKWYFPSEETKEFLLIWLSEQEVDL